MLRTPKVYEIPTATRIDDKATLETFGYPATSVSPSGSKKVVCSCSACNKRLERIRMRVRAPVLCPSCVKTKKSLGDPTGLVDEEATKNKFGYTTQELARHALDKVVGVCTTCKGNYDVRMKSVKEGQLCRPCIRKEWCKDNLPTRSRDGQSLLNDEETLRICGYEATPLSPKSFEYVISNCSCGETFKRIRRNVHDNSVCVSCGRSQINHGNLQQKRRATLIKKYPDGFVVSPSAYGKVVEELATRIEEEIGRTLVKEKLLTDGKRLDLYDQKSMVGIEYCGLHWHHENSKTPRNRTYHRDKMRRAQHDGYRLLTIFEDEYYERRDAVVGWILNVLGKASTVTYARKCKVQSVSTDEAKKFLETYHLQGPPHSLTCSFGLYKKEKLIGLLSGGRHHRQDHEDKLILSRLCFTPDIRISGGTERLYKRLREYAKEHEYKKIVTWSDNRWTEGQVYERLGMKLERELPPDYSYVDIRSPRKRLSKQSQKKVRTGCPAYITEKDWTLKNGLSRIWDCGRKRWVEEI